MKQSVEKAETSVQVKKSGGATEKPIEVKKSVEEKKQPVKATMSSKKKQEEVSKTPPKALELSSKEPDEPNPKDDASRHAAQSIERTQMDTNTQAQTTTPREQIPRSSSDESDAPFPLEHLKTVGGKRPVTGKARTPTAHLAKYNTDHYTRYDPAHPPDVEIIEGAFMSFARYDKYHLFVDGSLDDLDNVPTGAIRLDDLTISKLISVKKPKFLNDNWPAEFDRAGMIRATRIPMGIAAKIWANAGDEDVEGRVITNPGWYYLSWRGLHLLCGKEGMDAGVYKIRPSFESFVADGLCFFKKNRAVLQTDPRTEII